jgi:Mor family transcriptional regulator
MSENIDTSLLPPLLQDFVRLIGVTATMGLVRRYGGLRIYIPSPDRVTDDHPMAQIIGVSALKKLAGVYGQESHFQLPKAERALLAVRNAQIAAEYAGEKTARQLAMEHRLTEGQVVRIVSSMGVKAPDDRRQPALF